MGVFFVRSVNFTSTLVYSVVWNHYNNNHISLLRVTQENMHEIVSNQYTLVSMKYSLNRFKNVKKFGTYSLLDYVEWFKQNRNVTKRHLGKGVLS